MHMLNSLLAAVAFLLVWFGAFCFVTLTPDISQWQEFTRYFCVSTGLVFSSFIYFTVNTFYKGEE